MKLDKLYKALVVGGAALTLGACASTAPEVKTVPASEKPCSEVCKGEGTGRFCPSTEDGLKPDNCCWLMPRPRHRCCPQP